VFHYIWLPSLQDIFLFLINLLHLLFLINKLVIQTRNKSLSLSSFFRKHCHYLLHLTLHYLKNIPFAFIFPWLNCLKILQGFWANIPINTVTILQIWFMVTRKHRIENLILIFLTEKNEFLIAYSIQRINLILGPRNGLIFFRNNLASF